MTCWIGVCAIGAASFVTLTPVGVLRISITPLWVAGGLADVVAELRVGLRMVVGRWRRLRGGEAGREQTDEKRKESQAAMRN